MYMNSSSIQCHKSKRIQIYFLFYNLRKTIHLYLLFEILEYIF